MFKQIIIARKDLNMSPGKLSAQVAHASMAFLTTEIRRKAIKKLDKNIFMLSCYEKDGSPIYYTQPTIELLAHEMREQGKDVFYVKRDKHYHYEVIDNPTPFLHYECQLNFDYDLVHEWIEGSFTKVVLEAKNKNSLLKAKTMATLLGMEVNKDFFLIRDNCFTELKPEDNDGRTLTCIGFRPMDASIIDKIGKKFHTYT